MDQDILVQKRVPITGSAHIIFEGPNGAGSTDAILDNVSLSGIGVYADHPVPDGTEVSVELHFVSTTGKMETSSIEGTIVYCRKTKDLFFTGIEFSEDLSAESHRELYDHIRQSLK